MSTEMVLKPSINKCGDNERVNLKTIQNLKEKNKNRCSKQIDRRPKGIPSMQMGRGGRGIPESVMQTSTLFITQEEIWEFGRKSKEIEKEQRRQG